MATRRAGAVHALLVGIGPSSCTCAPQRVQQSIADLDIEVDAELGRI